MFSRIAAIFLVVLLPVAASAADPTCYSMNASQQAGFGEDIEVRISTTAGDEAHRIPAGFLPSGPGVCKFERLGNSGLDPDRDRRERMLQGGGEGFGYECIVRPNSHVFYRVSLDLVVCPTNPGHVGFTRNAPFNSIGLGGDAVPIAGSAAVAWPSDGPTLSGPVPYSVRLCNVKPGVPMSIDLSDSTPQLQPGKCLEVDKPQQAFARSLKADVEIFGASQLFQPGTFPKKARMGDPAKVAEDKRVKIGAFNSMTATCAPPAAGVPFDAHYWGYCPLTQLKDGKNYRVCFERGYSNQGDGQEYAGGLLKVVTDRKLMARAPVNGQLSPYVYQSIEPGGCRDMFGVKEASVLIVGDNNWIGQSVSLVTYRYAEISPPNP